MRFAAIRIGTGASIAGAFLSLALTVSPVLAQDKAPVSETCRLVKKAAQRVQ